MTRPRVLLVDDRVAVRRTLKSILSGFDCDFTEATEGGTALALISRRQFDVIFLDLHLPVFAGIEILRRARRRNIALGRVIILTGLQDAKIKAEALKLGVFRVLTKDPISHLEVKETFIAALAGGAPPRGLVHEPGVGTVAPPRESRENVVQDTRHHALPRVLVLDDQVAWLQTIARLLGNEFAVTLTTEPEEAFRWVTTEHFDAVIIDLKLPGGVWGLDVLTRMAASTPGLKAMILTGEARVGSDAEAESIRRGARAFKVKSQCRTLPEAIKAIVNAPATPPRVFLSYDRRDQPKVVRLYERLQKGGVVPWMDIKDLRGGTVWKAEIQQIIEEWSDHFIFCHSCHTANKEGPIRRELNLARERQKEFLDSRSFLITARLDQTEVERSLRDLHFVDLFRPHGFNKLLQTILGGHQAM
jgi:CheY-like chemotaxis protein